MKFRQMMALLGLIMGAMTVIVARSLGAGWWVAAICGLVVWVSLASAALRE